MINKKPVVIFITALSFVVLPAISENPPPINDSLEKALTLTDDTFVAALSNTTKSSEDTIAFYAKMGNQPVWYFQGNLTKCGHMAVETLQNASQEGLNPHDYEEATSIAENPKDWIQSELLLTKNFLEYIDHLRVGRVDPMRISRDIKFHSPKTHPVELLLDAVQDKESGCEKLRQMAPTFPQYQELRKTLAKYREMAIKKDTWPHIEETKPFKLGDKNPEVQSLRQLLILHGDLEEVDTNSTIFDETLDKALRQFQRRHTLEADGVVGGKTKEALNTSIEDLIHKVILNMERLRWLPDELGEKNIIVNVAGYEVRAYDKDQVKLEIPAIVGRPSRRTPLFYAQLKNVVVNPSWGVPYNILVHDKLPKIINDPDYVRRSGFTVTDDSGSIIDPDQADWENEGRHYHLRQSPGRHNALGRVKFNIENPYTIYLHGTPDEKLFKKTARPFSSGCIRLKAPIDLAVWVLNDESKWSADEIQNSINQGGTKTVNPAANIPVFFTYQTVWIGQDGLIHISDDPYRLDAKMEKVLKPESE
ncbi:MAG: L,D-transpeptidase family protein [Alphaproteobacteria bacterium]|nr:L,D-transpeptidase family protein [Alphaproteobacteria bacterium]